jgi:PKD repeat protein
VRVSRQTALRHGLEALLAWVAIASLAHGQLTADFEASPLTGAAPLTVSFVDTSTGATVESWVWNFGDGGISTEQHPSHVYTRAGSYTVSLTVQKFTGGFEFDVEIKPDLITVPLLPAFGASPSSGILPLTVQFTDMTLGSPTSWLWDFGDGGSSTEQHPSHTFLTPGSYSISLTAFHTGLMETVVEHELIIVEPADLDAGFSASVTSGVVPLTVSFDDESTGSPPTGWLWDFGDGDTSTTENPVHVFETPGTYTVSLTALYFSQEDTAVHEDLVTVAPVPLTAAFSTSTTSGSNPLTVSFTDETLGSPPTAWLWDFGDGGASAQQHPEHVFDAPGSFSVSLTAFFFGQSDTVTQRNLVTVTAAPITTSFSAGPLAGVPPLPVSFRPRVAESAPTAFLWDFGDGYGSAEATPTHTYVAPGVRDVTLTVFVGDQGEAHTIPGLVRVGPFVGEYLPASLISLDSIGSPGRVDASPLQIIAADRDVQEAKVLRRNPSGTWSLEAALTSDDPGTSAGFPSDVAISDRFALVGDASHDALADGAGAAYLFERQWDGKWIERALLLASDGAEGDRFGQAVALTNDLAVVGAPRKDAGGPNNGAAYVFERQPDGTWLEAAKLTGSGGGSSSHHLGQAVAVSGSRIIVGAPRFYFDGAPDDWGAAFLFERQPDGSWPSVATLALEQPFPEAGFGHAVALDGDRAVVGAPFDDHTQSMAGSATVFDRQPDGTWAHTQKLRPKFGDAINNQFGQSVDLEGDRVIVGMPGETTLAEGDGVVVIFGLDPSAGWREFGKLYSNEAFPQGFGTDVSLSGDVIVTSTPVGTEPKLLLLEILEALP